MKFKLSYTIRDPPTWNPNFRVEELMKIQTILLKTVGMCYIEFEHILPKKIAFLSNTLNWALFVFFSFVHLHIAALFFWEMIHSNAIPVITNAITMVIINTFAFITLLYYKLNYKKYLKMVDFMNANFLTRSAYGLTFSTTERSYILANRYTFWWTIMCVQGTMQWVFVPFLRSTRTLPIALKYLIVDELADPYYEIIFFLHSVCQFLLGMIFANASCVLASTVIITSGQFDMLLCSLKNLRATAMTMNGNRLKELRELQATVDFTSEELNQYYLAAELMDNVDENTAKMKANLEQDPTKFRPFTSYLPQDNYLTDLTEELNHAISASIRHHQMLIEFCAMMEEFFSVFVLLKSFQSTFQICNLVFTFLTIEGTDQYINMTPYLILTLLDVFQLCYFGETILQQSSHIGDALMRCPWYLCGGPFRRIMSIILVNSKKPLQMTGGKFFILGFSKLTSIMKASFSYFTLLQHFGK